jgi:hypothetical protein
MSVVKKNYDNQVIEKEESINLAFLIGPRRDGIILTKDGTLISTEETYDQKETLPTKDIEGRTQQNLDSTIAPISDGPTENGLPQKDTEESKVDEKDT